MFVSGARRPPGLGGRAPHCTSQEGQRCRCVLTITPDHVTALEYIRCLAFVGSWWQPTLCMETCSGQWAAELPWLAGKGRAGVRQASRQTLTLVSSSSTEALGPALSLLTEATLATGSRGQCPAHCPARFPCPACTQRPWCPFTLPAHLASALDSLGAVLSGMPVPGAGRGGHTVSPSVLRAFSAPAPGPQCRVRAAYPQAGGSSLLTAQTPLGPRPYGCCPLQRCPARDPRALHQISKVILGPLELP